MRRRAKGSWWRNPSSLSIRTADEGCVGAGGDFTTENGSREAAEEEDAPTPPAPPRASRAPKGDVGRAKSSWFGIGASGGRPAAEGSPTKELKGSPIGTPEVGEAATRAIVGVGLARLSAS